jgi:signal transduction histidine kinase
MSLGMTPAEKGIDERGRGLSLAQKFALAFLGLVSATLVVNGAIDMTLTYREARQQAVLAQQEKALAASDKVLRFVTEIEQQLGWTTRAEWSRVSVEQRRYDFIRLLRQTTAVSELLHIDGSGREQLRLSRLEPDAVASGTDLSADPRFVSAVRDGVFYGPVTFRRGSEPHMTIAIAHAGRNPGVSIAEINLKLAWDVVTAIRVGATGYAYITDPTGRLIAHPDMSLVLRNTSLAALPQVVDAMAGLPPLLDAKTTKGPDGRDVLSAYAVAPKIGWIVFVELPTIEALGPMWAALYRTLGLLALGVVLAGGSGVLLARRMVVPILDLQAGARRLGEGDLAQRIPVRTSDEIGALAQRFNQMAGQIQASHETLERRVETRTADLNMTLTQQTATAEILRVISASPTNVTPVLNAIAESAVRLCDGMYSAVAVLEDGVIRIGGLHNRADVSGSLAVDWFPMRAVFDSLAPDAIRDKRIIHQLNIQFDQDQPASSREIAIAAGYQTILIVPMMRHGDAIGAVVAAKAEGPFSERQIGLIGTFADQAVIAIENAQLFEELQAKTRELETSLTELKAAQARLIQSEKLASLGQLTAGIAHEIKNPLNFVNNFADLSAELVTEIGEALASVGDVLDPTVRADVEDLSATLKANLAKIVQHGRRADSIVKNMLAHSRESSGERRLVDVNALAEEALALCYHGARVERPGFNVTLEREFDPNAGKLSLYPQEMTRVLLNLISNGFHAVHKKRQDGAPHGFDPVLRVTTKAYADKIEIKVRDNGTGIPDAIRARIFEPFFTTKPTGEGTGLGLSLSHDIIVQQHGGTLEVVTEPGLHTEFTVTLPREAPSERG